MAKATTKKTSTGSTTGKLKAAAAKVAKSVADVTTTATTTPAAPVAKPARTRTPRAAASFNTSEVTMVTTHDQIAQKAYEIWMAKGCPQGRDEENWREAEAALTGAARR